MQQPTEPGRPMPAESFPTDPTGLPEAARPPLLELADGGTFDLRIGAVAKRLGDITVRMLGCTGSIPGPTPEGAAGIGGDRPRHQRRGPGGDRALTASSS